MVKVTVDLDADIARMRWHLMEVMTCLHTMRKRLWINRALALMNVAACAQVLATWASMADTLGHPATGALVLLNVFAVACILWRSEGMWHRAHTVRLHLLEGIAKYEAIRARTLLEQGGGE